jgi:EAL domain-containing protein (putative c-di-GMP-specific phosphodiesterase class I)
VDDFGTGYSSLSYLTTLPISEVKIDRSFVQKLGVTPKSTAVITTIVALARALGLRVIAEGVETLSQQNILHHLGCSYMQGFLFSKPMRGDAMPDWVRQFAVARSEPVFGPGAGDELAGQPEPGAVG